MPCSVCENINSFTSLTVYGKFRCPAGYNIDYHGYVFSSSNSDKKGQYVCVDNQAESYPNSQGSTQNNNARLFPVEVQCGTIPCPPYTGNREIVCTQCTKQFNNQCDDYYNDEGMCVRNCPKGKYANLIHVCHRCHMECLESCDGPLASDCIGDCRHVTLNGSCLNECPPGTLATAMKICVSAAGKLTSSRNSVAVFIYTNDLLH